MIIIVTKRTGSRSLQFIAVNLTTHDERIVVIVLIFVQ